MAIRPTSQRKIMILKMSRVSIIGPQNFLTEIMTHVYEAGVLHIEPPPEAVKDAPYVKKLTLPVEQKKEMFELERVLSVGKKTLNTITPLFIKPPYVTYGDREIEVSEAQRTIEEISKSVDDLSQGIRTLEQRLSLFTRYEKILTSLSPIMEIIPESPYRDYTGITLYKRESPLPVLEDAVKRITDGRYELLKKDIDEEIMNCVIVYPKEFGQKIKRLLHEENISELKMPVELADMPLMDALRTIMQEKTTLPIKIDEIEKRLKELAYDRYEELVKCYRIIEERLKQMEVSSDLYGTKNTFILCGWVPERGVHAFINNIKDRFNGMVVVEMSAPAYTDMDKSPVLLSNPGVLKPFEVLTRFLALPKYGTLDPTPLLAIFFPIFFGLILGDIGYGVILFLVSLWARWQWRSNETIRDLGSIFMVSSLCAVVFGIIFGEFFGNLGEYLGIHPYIDRSKALIPFLIFSILVGGLHISLGLFIGVIISLKRRETKEAMARLLKLIFVFSIFGAAAAAYGLLPWGFLRITVLSGIGIIILLFFFENWIAPFDAIKLIVNILSYARIMGFGAASVFLASIANRLTAMPRNLFIGIAIGIFFHLINILVGIYAPAIQTLRLHYVEFFDKFFYPGGIEYKPFGKGRKVVI